MRAGQTELAGLLHRTDRSVPATASPIVSRCVAERAAQHGLAMRLGHDPLSGPCTKCEAADRVSVYFEMREWQRLPMDSGFAASVDAFLTGLTGAEQHDDCNRK